MTTIERVHPHIFRSPGGRDPEYRFQKLITPGDIPAVNPALGPCILHGGADNGHGYAQFSYNGRNGYAHRYAWERVNGRIPDGLTIDHLCEVRRCVNVDHLNVTDLVSNYLRTKLAKTTCPNGHKYLAGTFVINAGRRNCLICRRATSRADGARRARIANGLPDRRARYDQTTVRAVVAAIRADETTIAQGARDIGCHPNYLGRRVWRETRKDVLARDGDRCYRCGHAALDVHHRVARGRGGTSTPRIAFGLDNLISVCRGCHTWIHGHPTLARDPGWLLRRTDPISAAPVERFGVGIILLDRDGTYELGAA